jgi:hypothetical protein
MAPLEKTLKPDHQTGALQTKFELTFKPDQLNGGRPTTLFPGGCFFGRRGEIITVAFVVVTFSIFMQGLTMPWFVCRLRLLASNPGKA